MKVILVYNILFSYPSTFIDNQFHKFFFEYISSSPSPFITDEKQFFLMCHNIIDQPTPRQSQVAMRAATANIDNDPTDEEQNESKESSIKKTGKNETNYGDKLFIHYTHEKRFHSFKRDMHQVYDDIFKNTNAMDLKLIVGNCNRRDARNELIRKRPKPSLLKDKPKKE